MAAMDAAVEIVFRARFQRHLKAAPAGELAITGGVSALSRQANYRVCTNLPLASFALANPRAVLANQPDPYTFT